MRSNLQSPRPLRSPRPREDRPILITGSLFVVGEGREAVGLAEPDLEWVALNRAGVAPASTDDPP